jgi:hypothetical protein
MVATAPEGCRSTSARLKSSNGIQFKAGQVALTVIVQRSTAPIALRQPIEERKRRLLRLLSKAHNGIRYNEHLQADGTLVFARACELGCEGIVSKRRGSRYRSGRNHDWLKTKNPQAPAVRRLEEEDWN